MIHPVAELVCGQAKHECGLFAAHLDMIAGITGRYRSAQLSELGRCLHGHSATRFLLLSKASAISSLPGLTLRQPLFRRQPDDALLRQRNPSARFGIVTAFADKDAHGVGVSLGAMSGSDASTVPSGASCAVAASVRASFRFIPRASESVSTASLPNAAIVSVSVSTTPE